MVNSEITKIAIRAAMHIEGEVYDHIMNALDWALEDAEYEGDNYLLIKALAMKHLCDNIAKELIEKQ